MDNSNTEIIKVDEDFFGEPDSSKTLILKKEKGFFKPKDIFWIDEFIIKEWQLSNSGRFQLELTLTNGDIHVVNASSSKKLGGFITAVASTFEKMGLKPGEVVIVNPVI